MDLIKDLQAQGYKPEINADDDFKPIKGKYVCRIDTAGRVQGTSDKTGTAYDFYSISIQVVDVVEGDKATNRFLKLRYNADLEGVKKLLNDLFTSGISLSVESQDQLDSVLPGLKDRLINVRAWGWTPEKDMNGRPLPEDARKAVQTVKVVKDIKATGKGKAKSDIPF